MQENKNKYYDIAERIYDLDGEVYECVGSSLGRHHDDAAARDIAVMADIADMPGTALNPRILFQFIHIPVD